MPELIDLLPEKRRRARRRKYFLRLATVASYLALALTLVACVLLIPLFVYLSTAEVGKRAQISALEATASSTQESALSSRLSALTTDAKTLDALQSTPSVTHLMQEALAVPRQGIILSGLAYTAESGSGKATKPGTLLLTGIAASRDALRAYQLALQNQADFASADLPIATYAKDQSIPFVITVTLSLTQS